VFTNYRPNSRFNELFRRAEGNPILTASGWPYLVNAVFNPGDVRRSDGHTLLLARFEDRTDISHLTAARSQDGMTNWHIDPQPTYAPSPELPKGRMGRRGCSHRLSRISLGHAFKFGGLPFLYCSKSTT
jgi:hypothetical protein